MTPRCTRPLANLPGIVSNSDWSAQGIAITVNIPYDDEFRMMTLPTTARGVALVDSGKGVKINHLHYWSTTFRDPAIERTRVPVRYDPYDAGTAYAYVGNHWISCYAEHFSSFRGRSEREMMIAAAELRKRSQDHSREFKSDGQAAGRLCRFGGGGGVASDSTSAGCGGPKNPPG